LGRTSMKKIFSVNDLLGLNSILVNKNISPINMCSFKWDLAKRVQRRSHWRF
jgi:hypothetical protein